MPLSALLLAILEQAKEPLHCLHGAGYFTPEEWVQLDLIMNKEYKWTTGPPKNFIHNNGNGLISLERETSLPFYVAGSKEVSNSDATSFCASIEPAVSDINISSSSAYTHWEYPVKAESSNSLKPFVPHRDDLDNSIFVKDHGKPVKYNSTQKDNLKDPNISMRETIPYYSTSITGSDEKSSLCSSARKMKSISAWSSDVQNNNPQKHISRPKLKNRPAHQASPTTSQSKKNSSCSSRYIIAKDCLKHYQNKVNLFETSNAAEWDYEGGQLQEKKISPKRSDSSILVEENTKISNLNVQESHKKSRYQATVSSLSPHTVTRSSNRVLDVQRLTRHKESKDRKKSKDDTNTQQKTRVCWFWAESPSGCRYNSDECLNLHMKPTPKILLRQSMGDEKLTQSGCGTTASSIRDKLLTCWSQETTGLCDKEDNCKDMHLWVVGRAAPVSKEDISSEEIQARRAVIDNNQEITVVSASEASSPITRHQKKEKMHITQLVDFEMNDHETNDSAPSHSSALLSIDSTLLASGIQA